MIVVYTQEMFEKDKKEIIEWLEKNWQYNSEYSTYLGNILTQIKQWSEAIKRNEN